MIKYDLNIYFYVYIYINFKNKNSIKIKIYLKKKKLAANPSFMTMWVTFSNPFFLAGQPNFTYFLWIKPKQVGLTRFDTPNVWCIKEKNKLHKYI